MAGTAAAHRHSELENALAELARAQAETQAELRRLAQETREAQARSEANLDRLGVEMQTAGERAGLLMIGLDTGLLRILNSPDFRPIEL